MKRNKIVNLTCGLFTIGAALLFCCAYVRNLPMLFYASGSLIVISLPMTVFTSRWMRGFLFAPITANTIALFILTVLVVDAIHWIERSESHGRASTIPEMTYTYRDAKGNPDSFRRWWDFYREQWYAVNKGIQVADTNGVLPYVPKPNSTIRFFDCEIHFNEFGFRGNPIEQRKNGQYRIIALGESTTMGATIRAGDEPWPVMLERILNERFPQRQIEVINAGLSGYNLEHNLHRLDYLLTFAPDMIISYHGWNGFGSGFLPVGKRFFPILLPARPSYNLARIELLARQVKRRFQGIATVQTTPRANDWDSASSSKYAELYRLLVRNTPAHVRIVLLTFNVAVDQHSPKDVMAFYRSAFPDVDAFVVANQLHTHLLTSMKFPSNVTVVDTSANINGKYDKDLFIDAIHLTNKGRSLLSSNVFDGVERLIAEDLGSGQAPYRMEQGTRNTPGTSQTGAIRE